MISICSDTTELDGVVVTTYGIIVGDVEYRDLCTDMERVKAFADKIEAFDGFSLIDDLVEDFIEEIYGE